MQKGPVIFQTSHLENDKVGWLYPKPGTAVQTYAMTCSYTVNRRIRCDDGF